MSGFDLTQPVLGILAVPGCDYVRLMLDALAAGRPTVIMQGAEDTRHTGLLELSEIITPQPGGGWLDMPFAAPADDALAMVSFTSGTEGTPKAVYLSRANLHDVVTRLTNVMELTDAVREYVGVPPDHSFGYGRCRAVLAAGGRCFLPDGGFDLTEIRTMLRAGEINAISAVPSLWRVFLQNIDVFGDELHAVRWVEIGSQYMAPSEKVALRDALPNARIVQHYGLTEASRSTFLRIDDPKAALDSVGQPTGGIEVRINAAGRICIRGSNVARAIRQGNEVQHLSKDDWLETSDQGHLDADGTLYFDGRADDMINCGGIKLSPDQMEAFARNTTGTAADFGILRRPDPLRGDGILLALGPDAAAAREGLIDAICDFGTREGVSLRGAIVAQTTTHLPRTNTGKLQRKKLAADLDTIVPAEPSAPPAPNSFEAFISDLLGPEALSSGKSFDELSGDSLNHMQITLALEKSLGAAPAHWEWMPLQALAEQVADAGALVDLTAPGGGAPPLPNGSTNENPKGISFWNLVREDFHTNGSSLTHQGFWMLFVHRFGNWRMDVRFKVLRAPLTVIYLVLNKLTELFFGMKLGYTVKVGRRVTLEHFGGMILGAREIGNDVILRQNTTMGVRSVEDVRAKPTIGNGVDVGAGAVIVGNITVGDNAIIGANSVVYTNVPPNAVVVGVPGRVIGTRPQKD